MKRLMILFVTFLAACGDDLEPLETVDMSYFAEVTELENTCEDRPLDSTRESFIDAQRRADGTLELLENASLIPGPGRFPNVRPRGGEVDYDARRYSPYPDKTYPYRIEGTLTMEKLDLTFTEHWYRGSDFRDCVRRVRAVGRPRGFRDPAALDGRYEIRTAYYGTVCEGDPLPPQPLGEGVYVLDAHPREEGLIVVLAGAIYLESDHPSDDGSIDWSGRVYLAALEGIEELDGGLSGVFAPDGVRVELSFHTLDQPAGCSHVYALDGAKRPAPPVDVGGDYLAVYRVRSECEGTVSSYESQLTVVRQGPGEIEFIDAMGDWYIDADGADVRETDGAEAEGLTATFSGTAEPPYVSYTVEFRYYDGAGESCAYAWDVDAVARYAPEVSWEPAFLPDPPNPNDKTGILRSALSSGTGVGAFTRGPRQLGPLMTP